MVFALRAAAKLSPSLYHQARRSSMQSTVSPSAIRKLITLGLIASMSAGVLLTGNAAANVKPVPREVAARSTKRLANSYPNLLRFASDLTKLARLGKLQMVTGYDAE